jgi:hypothetical protein
MRTTTEQFGTTKHHISAPKDLCNASCVPGRPNKAPTSGTLIAFMTSTFTPLVPAGGQSQRNNFNPILEEINVRKNPQPHQRK